MDVEKLEWQPVRLAHPDLWCLEKREATKPESVELAKGASGDIVWCADANNLGSYVCSCKRVYVRPDNVRKYADAQGSPYDGLAAISMCQIQAD